MRDRLIEILTKTFDEQYEKRRLITPQHTADYLLANGVIVPPCKIGDILWIPSVNSNRVYSKVIEEILIREKDGEIGKYVYASSVYFPFENIGKTVFLTREEAESAINTYDRKLRDEINAGIKQYFNAATREVLTENVVSMLMCNDTYKKLSDSMQTFLPTNT